MNRLPNSHLPAPLAAAAERAFHDLLASLTEALAARVARVLEASAETAAELATVLGCSEFVADAARADPEALLRLLEGGVFRDATTAETLERLLETLPLGLDLEQLKSALRRVRREAMLRIVWREAVRRSSFEETAAALSRLADRTIDRALAELYRHAADRHGAPVGGESEQELRLAVIALGKLGAGELNLSSDVDLVFAYREEGATSDGRTNREFFTRLAHRLIQALDQVTAEGFVFRVDMRLRPHGASAAIVHDFADVERYFEEHGRDWERYAWIRARPCAGDIEGAASLIAALRPFVYRRYLDFAAIGALREMKLRVDQERSTERVRDDVKLGPGGIREIEFVVQMFQLVWGGRLPVLQRLSVLETIDALAGQRLLDERDARELAAAYRFLRDTEHRIQAIRDQQTQALPVDDRDRARLALMMGFQDYGGFLRALDEHRRRVARRFEAMIAEPAHGDRAQADTLEPYRLAWTTAAEAPAALASRLAVLGFPDPEAAAQALTALEAARSRPWVSAQGNARLDELVPRLLAEAARAAQPTVALGRVVPLLEAVLRRSSYFVLLLENPNALRELVSLCGESRWLAGELARHPMLLDELLDASLLYTVPDREALARDLRARMAGMGERDHALDAERYERALEILRAFKESHQFRVAACELKGILPLMKISDYLTFVAEVVLNESLDLAWRQTPDPREGERGDARPFVIVGYGKLGGLELGPGSDLDLVFIHDLDADDHRFLNRLVRRLLQILTTRTHTGALYDVDMRLRPSGRRGAMVSSLAAFAAYQKDDAWVWEHQALVRARPVAGDAELARRFEAVRSDVLRRAREREALRRAVVDMRARIEQKAEGDDDFKRAAGGIVDIEFMVQYLALAWAATFPELIEFTDNVRILDAAARVGLLSVQESERLKEAYLALRAESHRVALDAPDRDRARRVLERHHDVVRDAWQTLLGGDAGRAEGIGSDVKRTPPEGIDE